MSRDTGPAGEAVPTFFGSLSRSICGEFSDAWPLMQNPSCGDDISSCASYPELPGEDVHSLNPESASSASLDSNSSQGLVGRAVPIQAHPESFTETTDLSRLNNSVPEPALTQDALTARNQLAQERGDVHHLATQPSPQVRQRWIRCGHSSELRKPRGNRTLSPIKCGGTWGEGLSILHNFLYVIGEYI